MPLTRLPVIGFLSIWIGYFILVAIEGAVFSSYTLRIAVLLQALFVGITAGVCVFLPKVERAAATGEQTSAAALIAVALVLSLLGIASLYYDYRSSGIDYTSLSSARSEMVRMASQQGPSATMWSVFGHLFSTSFFVATGVVLIRKVSTLTLLATLAASSVCLLLYSFVASSRSGIMLYVAFAAFMLCIRPAFVRVSLRRLHWPSAVFAVAAVAICFVYVGAVFQSRADATGITADQYADKFSTFLGVEGETPHSLVGNGTARMVILYASHSAYTFASILDEPADDGRIMFTYPQQLLARVHLAPEPDTDWSKEGRFASVPGALYHDFGLAGLVLGAFTLGVAVWAARAALLQHPNSTLLLGLTGGLGTILFLTPIHFAGDFMAFPFIGFAFITVPTIARGVSWASGARSRRLLAKM